MESFEAFIINNWAAENLDIIASDLLTRTGSKVSTYQINLSADDSATILVFEFKQQLREIEAVFPGFNITPVRNFERVLRTTTIYLGNIPDGLSPTSVQEIVRVFGKTTSYVASSYLPFFTMSRDFESTCVARILPVLQFKSGKFNVYTDYKDIPIVHLGQISTKITEEDIVNYISEVCPVVKSYVQPKDDKVFSLNVLLNTIEDARKVIKELNFSKMQGEEILFTPYIPSDLLERMKAWQLKVENLPPGTECRQLYDFFERYGQVFSVNIKSDTEKPFAFVLFEQEEAAKAAIDDSKELQISYTRAIDFKNVFVSYLPYNISERRIREVFPKAVTVEINQNPKSNWSPAHVTLTFNTAEEGEEAVRIGNETFIRGVRLHCTPRIPKDMRQKITFGVKDNESCTLFIKNLPSDINFEELAGFCKEFGTVDRLTVKNGPIFSTAIVQFSSEDIAKTAYEEIPEFKIVGKRPQVEYYKPSAKLENKTNVAKELAKKQQQYAAKRK